MKICAKCHHEGRCLKGEKHERCDCFLGKDDDKHDKCDKCDKCDKHDMCDKKDDCKDDYKDEK